MRVVTWMLLAALSGVSGSSAAGAAEHRLESDVAIVGGTPAGITAAVAAAREGRRVLLLERTAHLGGLPANGLGATDIATRGATGGLFLEFVRRIRAYYGQTYGVDSPQLRDCSDGYAFEPHVAERVLKTMLAEYPGVRVLKRRQFDAETANVVREGDTVREIRITDRDTGAIEQLRAQVFIDATSAAAQAIAGGRKVRDVDLSGVQCTLVRHGAVPVYFRDLPPEHPAFAVSQLLAVRGVPGDWNARPDDRPTAAGLAAWTAALKLDGLVLSPAKQMSRGAAWQAIGCALQNKK